MTLRTIITLPVTAFDKNLQTLIDDMIETMRQAPGVGLAAPQIGIGERLAVIEYSEEDDEEEGEAATEKPSKPPKPKQLFVIINPEIVKTSEEKVNGVEGCLSIPGLVGEVERHEKLQVKALNRHGKPVKIKAEGWLARIFQHEIDHLNGVLFTDLARRVWQMEPGEEEDRV
jgi:peptide deformylase